MRVSTAFSLLAFTAFALGAALLWLDISGIGQATGVPGSFAQFTQDTRFETGPALGPETKVGPETKLGPQTTLGMAAQPAPPLLGPAKVNVSAQGFYSWALLDRTTGMVSGSANAATGTNTTESMVKIWIAADYLRLLADANPGTPQPSPAKPSQDRLDELSRMIRDSDNNAAEDVYELDGSDAVIERMISICGLTETSVTDGWWARTELSARDAVRLGACVADGHAAGPDWTPWILNEMRQVRGEGRFGIVDALPTDVAAQIPIKNGWTVVGNEWHLNCLAVVDRYVLAVLTRYPASLGLDYGAGICRSVTSQLRRHD